MGRGRAGHRRQGGQDSCGGARERRPLSEAEAVEGRGGQGRVKGGGGSYNPGERRGIPGPGSDSLPFGSEQPEGQDWGRG